MDVGRCRGGRELVEVGKAKQDGDWHSEVRQGRAEQGQSTKGQSDLDGRGVMGVASEEVEEQHTSWSCSWSWRSYGRCGVAQLRGWEPVTRPREGVSDRSPANHVEGLAHAVVVCGHKLSSNSRNVNQGSAIRLSSPLLPQRGGSAGRSGATRGTGSDTVRSETGMFCLQLQKRVQEVLPPLRREEMKRIGKWFEPSEERLN
ncbi:hypothetical protein ANO11243_078740 [Dothideomycetidae sp. 11243]|nr:hypothetical protein ANO11243_078740 [fungal sp. No.11243]